ncbi:hypothetical protein DID88_006784 [Monilinia fructigena]|uniref:Uncharacterized protein n=1 Tax=Monilinia fructigena TaxID=38457 RepID=A0A395IGQ7_9HELO|nr:hypothetical protein DID88_006784 [Monilinia fructigena]
MPSAISNTHQTNNTQQQGLNSEENQLRYALTQKSRDVEVQEKDYLLFGFRWHNLHARYRSCPLRCPTDAAKRTPPST